MGQSAIEYRNHPLLQKNNFYNKITPESIFGNYKSEPPIQPPYKIGIVGVFKNNSSSSIFFSNAIKRSETLSDIVSDVYEFDYRRVNPSSGFIGKDCEMVKLSKKCDILIIQKGNGIPVDTVRECAKHATIIHWFMDWFPQFTCHPDTLAFSKYCHYRTATGYDTALLWSEQLNLPTYHVIDGTDPTTYYPEEVQKVYDVSFIGGTDAERDAIYKFLKKYRWNVAFFGPKYTGRFIFPDEFRSICSKSNIVLNISRGNYKGYSSLRLWNLLACGSLVLTKRIPYMREHLKLHAYHHLDKFESILELKEKIEFYMDNDRKRTGIGANARKFVINNRTWEHSVCELMYIAMNDHSYRRI